jgi:hypothetical protein
MPRRIAIIRVAAALAATTLAGAALVPSASAQCGQEYRDVPAHSTVPGGPPLAIGDSVLADAVPELVRYGFEADGMVCRQMSQGIAILRQRKANLPHLVVLALGANGEVTPQQIDAALALLGSSRVLVLVTPHGGVLPSTPGVIRAAAAAHPNRILLLDWDRLAAEHPAWLASDGVHLGGAAGVDGFARTIASVLSHAAPANPEPEASSAELGAPETLKPPPEHRHAARHKPARHSATPRVPPRGPQASTSPPARPRTDLPVPSANRSSSTTSQVLPAAVAATALMLAAAAVLWARRRRG